MTLEQLARHLKIQVKDFFDDTETPHSVQPMSDHAMKVRNAVTLLSEDDLEIVAGLVDVLESRKRRKG